VENIICRFRLPYAIVSDNGSNFASKHMVNFCCKYKITHWYSTATTNKGITQSSIAYARVWAREGKMYGKTTRGVLVISYHKAYPDM